MSELNILIPDETIKLRETEVCISPCKVSQLRKILGLINKYVEKIAETEDMIELTRFLLNDSGEQGLNDIFAVLISCCKFQKDSVDSKFLDNLFYDELALLVSKFLQLNKDFFGRIAKQVSGAVAKEQPKIGENKSPD
jgi:hypothetical protein